MFMALMRKLFNRESAAIDRNIQLQEVKQVEDDVPTPVHHEASHPNVIRFADREELIERGYWLARRPRLVRRVNLTPDVAAEPGAARRVNRLLKRGYYRSLRHAA